MSCDWAGNVTWDPWLAFAFSTVRGHFVRRSVFPWLHCAWSVNPVSSHCRFPQWAACTPDNVTIYLQSHYHWHSCCSKLSVTSAFFRSLFLFSNQEKQNKVQVTAYSGRNHWLFLKPAPGSTYRLLRDLENMKSTWLGDKTQTDLQWWQKQKS